MNKPPHFEPEDEFFIQSLQSKLPTTFGDFYISAFGFKNDDSHLFLEYGENPGSLPPLVRIHSECVTSEVFGSLKCDCRDQLYESIEIIKKAGHGIIIYLRQEGRGIGLFNKINAYKLQEDGLDTVEANHKLNFETDLRNYYVAYTILHKKQINTIRLITNNNDKVIQLKKYGLIIAEVINTKPHLNLNNQHYIETKIKKLGHKYNL